MAENMKTESLDAASAQAAESTASAQAPGAAIPSAASAQASGAATPAPARTQALEATAPATAPAPNRTKAWALLLGAIFFEVCGTTCLKLSEGFTIWYFVVAFVVVYSICFVLFAYALVDLPIGLAYGVWGAIGTVATTLIGVVIWHDVFTPLMCVGLILVVAGIYLLNKGDEEAMTA